MAEYEESKTSITGTAMTEKESVFKDSQEEEEDDEEEEEDILIKPKDLIVSMINARWLEVFRCNSTSQKVTDASGYASTVKENI